MTLRIVNFDSVGAGIRVDLALGENLWVAPDVIVGTTDTNTYAIRAAGGGHRMRISGTVLSDYYPSIGIGTATTDSGNSLIIEQGARVQNFGPNQSIFVVGMQSSILNNGMIIGGVSFAAVSASTQSTFTNYGVIESDWFAVGRGYSTANMETIVFVNNGTIKGKPSYHGFLEGTDLVTNNGTMIGAVDLGSGNDVYNGANGHVQGAISGDGGNDTLIGGTDSDLMNGGSGNDLIQGNAGNDSLSGGNDNDTLIGGAGSDFHDGGVGNDWLQGDDGNDALFGGNDNDTLIGGAGNDLISGDAGNDWIQGGLGNDTLSGGAGSDVFIFDTTPNKKTNFDTITDFSVVDDSIWLDNAVFKSLGKKGTLASPAKLDKKFFIVGDKAKDKDDYLIYNNKTGVLYYDPDGTGKAKPVEIAKLAKGLKLTAADFFVI